MHMTMSGRLRRERCKADEVRTFRDDAVATLYALEHLYQIALTSAQRDRSPLE